MFEEMRPLAKRRCAGVMGGAAGRWTLWDRRVRGDSGAARRVEELSVISARWRQGAAGSNMVLIRDVGRRAIPSSARQSTRARIPRQELLSFRRESGSASGSAVVRRVISQRRLTDTTGSPLAFTYFIDPRTGRLRSARVFAMAPRTATMSGSTGKARRWRGQACSPSACVRVIRRRATISRASRNRTACRIYSAISRCR